MAPERKIVLGTDFSGLCAPSLALKQLRVDHSYAFACDIEPSCRKVLAHCHGPELIYPNIEDRDSNTTPKCHLYLSGFPCQAFSSLGLRLGTRDLQRRGLLVAHSLDYINVQRPVVCIMENVADMLAPRNQQLHDLATTTLTSIGYIIGEAVLNTADFGLPQQRRRWFLLAIRQDCLRMPSTDLSHLFPAPVNYCIRLDRIVTPLPADKFKMLPQGNTKSAKLWRANVRKAYEKTIGANPFRVPVVVDMKSSHRFTSHGVNQAPCLTRQRCYGMGYWCSFKGGVLNCTEMAMLQGIPETFDWEGAGISECQYGGMIGNSMSVNVLTCLLPEVLYAANLVSLRKRNAMRQLAF